MVWGEAFAGGFGALIARSRPGLDADPLRIRSYIVGPAEFKLGRQGERG